MHNNVERGLEEIDAFLYNGDVSNEDLKAIKEYLDRWNKKVPEIEKFNSELDEILNEDP
jgi:hypothetical protein